jgi:cytoskeleton protein RodZ
MEPTSEGSARQQPGTAGAWLKSARQQRGLHIAALAVMLKVPQAKLEALEADRFDELPDATFARALATAMCRALKVDPAPVLALLPRTHASDFDVPPGLNQPFRERGSPIDGNLLALAARPVVWGPALLLLAAAGVYFLPAGWLPERDAPAPAPVAAFPAAASAVVAASAAVVEFVSAPVAASLPASEPAASAPAAMVARAPSAPAASAPRASASAPATVATPAPAPAPVAVPAGQALRITATADTWVEVVDGQGQTQLARLLRAGEQQVLGGTAPYRLKVGNVGGTRVEWRGAAVDLAARSKDNVARLELN